MCLYKKSSLSTWSVVYLRSVPPNRPASLPPPPWRIPPSTLSSSPSTQSRSRYTLSRDVPTTSGRRRRWRSSARERTYVGPGWKRSRRPSPAPVSQTSLWLVDKIQAALSSPGKSNKSVIGCHLGWKWRVLTPLFVVQRMVSLRKNNSHFIEQFGKIICTYPKLASFWFNWYYFYQLSN